MVLNHLLAAFCVCVCFVLVLVLCYKYPFGQPNYTRVMHLKVRYFMVTLHSSSLTLIYILFLSFFCCWWWILFCLFLNSLKFCFSSRKLKCYKMHWIWILEKKMLKGIFDKDNIGMAHFDFMFQNYFLFLRVSINLIK